MDKQIRYQKDKTGLNKDNLVKAEVHYLKTQVRNRVVVPHEGSFFTDSLVVWDKFRELYLVRGIDYVCGGLRTDYTVQAGKEVSTFIVVVNEKVSNQLEVTYQSFGHFAQNQTDTVIDMLETAFSDEKNIPFKKVIGLPSKFDPTFHYHDLGDIESFEPLLFGLEKIRNSIASNSNEIFNYLVEFESLLQAIFGKSLNVFSDQLYLLMEAFKRSFHKGNFGLDKLENHGLFTEKDAIDCIAGKKMLVRQEEEVFLHLRALSVYTAGLYELHLNKNETGIGDTYEKKVSASVEYFQALPLGSICTIDSYQNAFAVNEKEADRMYPSKEDTTTEYTVRKLSSENAGHGAAFLYVGKDNCKVYVMRITTKSDGVSVEFNHIVDNADSASILESIEKHKANKENPHLDDRRDVKLSQVENLPIATMEEVICNIPARKYVTLRRLLTYMKRFKTGRKDTAEIFESFSDQAMAKKMQTIFSPCGAWDENIDESKIEICNTFKGHEEQNIPLLWEISADQFEAIVFIPTAWGVISNVNEIVIEILPKWRVTLNTQDVLIVLDSSATTTTTSVPVVTTSGVPVTTTSALPLTTVTPLPTTTTSTTTTTQAPWVPGPTTPAPDWLTGARLPGFDTMVVEFISTTGSELVARMSIEEPFVSQKVGYTEREGVNDLYWLGIPPVRGTQTFVFFANDFRLANASVENIKFNLWADWSGPLKSNEGIYIKITLTKDGLTVIENGAATNTTFTRRAFFGGTTVPVNPNNEHYNSTGQKIGILHTVFNDEGKVTFTPISLPGVTTPVPVSYHIDSDETELREGEQGRFTFNIFNSPPVQNVYARFIPVNAQDDIFENGTSGFEVPLTSNGADIFARIAQEPVIYENSEFFTVVTPSVSDTTILAASALVKVGSNRPFTELPVPSVETYTLTADKTKIGQGQRITYTLVTENVPVGKILVPKFTMSADARSKMVDQPFNGEIVVMGDTTEFYFEMQSGVLLNPNEYFQFVLKETSFSRRVLVTSPVAEIEPYYGTPTTTTVIPYTYSYTVNKLELGWGDECVVTVNTNAPDGVELDFYSSPGVHLNYITGLTQNKRMFVSGGKVTLKFTLNSDAPITGNNNFLAIYVSQKAPNPSADAVLILEPIKLTGGIVTTTTTTLAPLVYTIDADKGVVDKGQSIAFTITAPGIPDGTTHYIDLQMSRSSAAHFTSGTKIAFVTFTGGVATYTLSVKEDASLLTNSYFFVRLYGSEYSGLLKNGPEIWFAAPSANQNDTSVFYGDIDFMTVEYTQGGGVNLAARAKVIYNTNFEQTDNWLTVGSGLASNDLNAVVWGGGKTAEGNEVILVDFTQLRNLKKMELIPSMFFKSLWFGDIGVGTISFKATAYVGGTMVKAGNTWTNPTATKTTLKTLPIRSMPYRSINASDEGKTIAILSYDRRAKETQFYIDTTPYTTPAPITTTTSTTTTTTTQNPLTRTVAAFAGFEDGDVRDLFRIREEWIDPVNGPSGMKFNRTGPGWSDEHFFSGSVMQVPYNNYPFESNYHHLDQRQVELPLKLLGASNLNNITYKVYLPGDGLDRWGDISTFTPDDDYMKWVQYRTEAPVDSLLAQVTVRNEGYIFYFKVPYVPGGTYDDFGNEGIRGWVTFFQNGLEFCCVEIASSSESYSYRTTMVGASKPYGFSG